MKDSMVISLIVCFTIAFVFAGGPSIKEYFDTRYASADQCGEWTEDKDVNKLGENYE